MDKRAEPNSIVSMYVINLRIYIFTTIGQQLLVKRNAKTTTNKQTNDCKVVVVGKYTWYTAMVLSCPITPVLYRLLYPWRVVAHWQRARRPPMSEYRNHRH